MPQFIGLQKSSGCRVFPNDTTKSEVEGELSIPQSSTRNFPASQIASLEPEPNAHFSGEMIDDGMEWLQTLFENDLDTNLPSVWD